MKRDLRFSRRRFLKSIGAGAALLPMLHADRTDAACYVGGIKRLYILAWTNGMLSSINNWATAGNTPTSWSLGLDELSGFAEALHERPPAAEGDRLQVHQGHARLGRADGARLLPRHADRRLLPAALLGDELRPRRRDLRRPVHRQPAAKGRLQGARQPQSGDVRGQHRSPLLVGGRSGRAAQSRSQQRLQSLLQGLAADHADDRHRRRGWTRRAAARAARRSTTRTPSSGASSTPSSPTSIGSRTSSAARTSRASTST